MGNTVVAQQDCGDLRRQTHDLPIQDETCVNLNGAGRAPVPVEISDTNGARWRVYPGDGATGQIITDPGYGQGDGTVYFSWNDWANSSYHPPQTFLVVVDGKGRRSVRVNVAK